mmetsp:Transcript_17315/g.42064  ORF Transcript_17315/g.42064 Transcript_17315/m.42064 type:complete len:572 (-) Transcript_17315:136-1851(-)|eukprot:CAMPEP_0113507746 /NCGR_PEP_ID=MMETSP0014_2-20120614/36635_1 /TAXON_ID=2857 /ORGANISM="Nitzschia sp." /LENGTH=571 /DNA_ID=CAMNT_0000403387 /DNA_START=227 /DNA_END=1942 /DNA_ORIENTATION=+ /assembly_acc=CAM_ASM_000159
MSLSLPFRNLSSPARSSSSSSSPRSVTTTSLSLHDEPEPVQQPRFGNSIVGGGYDDGNHRWNDHRLIYKARALHHHPISTDNSFDSSYHSPKTDEEEDRQRQQAPTATAATISPPAISSLLLSPSRTLSRRQEGNFRHDVLCSSFTLGSSSPPSPPPPPPAAGTTSYIKQGNGNTTVIDSRNSCSSISTNSRRKRKLPLQPTTMGPTTITTTNTLSFDEEEEHTPRTTTSRRRMNFRHRSVCHETVQWLAAAETMAVAANAHATNTTNVVAEEEDVDEDLSSSKHTSTKRPRFPSSSSSRPVVEELWLGPVFEDSRTILSAIKTLPSSVRSLDLDLRNALHLLPQAMPVLLRKTHITTLSIRFFGDAGAIELAKWIHLNPNLERLNLQGNRIGSLGARTLVDAIIASGLHRRSLKHLNLSCNCILHGDLIGQLLALSTSLQSVDVQFNWLGDQGVHHICQGLRKNTSLRELNLYGCQRVTKTGLETLLKCLELHNTSLHSIKAQALDEESEQLVTRIRYWTDLNKAGRYLVHSSSVPSGIWPLALQTSSTDQDQPNALYHLLRHGNPKILY